VHDGHHWTKEATCLPHENINSFTQLIGVEFLQVHFDCLWIINIVYCKSPLVKCLLVSNEVSDGTVISPDLKKPKKQSVTADHNINISASVLWGDQYSLSFSKIAGVIGKHTLADDSWAACNLCIPDCTSRRRDMDMGFWKPKGDLPMCYC